MSLRKRRTPDEECSFTRKKNCGEVNDEEFLDLHIQSQEAGVVLAQQESRLHVMQSEYDRLSAQLEACHIHSEEYTRLFQLVHDLSLQLSDIKYSINGIKPLTQEHLSPSSTTLRERPAISRSTSMRSMTSPLALPSVAEFPSPPYPATSFSSISEESSSPDPIGSPTQIMPALSHHANFTHQSNFTQQRPARLVIDTTHLSNIPEPEACISPLSLAPAFLETVGDLPRDQRRGWFDSFLPSFKAELQTHISTLERIIAVPTCVPDAAAVMMHALTTLQEGALGIGAVGIENICIEFIQAIETKNETYCKFLITSLQSAAREFFAAIDSLS
eukprot:TRINITY_DN26612_c0_g1_i1.p1 TRINITY_DN26612_c0_g1~~TRINITY_DN26612_c0_g1_i1.p1  ORF type:complete len:331 (-),score=33.23 TRINITY_DN26612_c0_g1_i1:115-1107(-)